MVVFLNLIDCLLVLGELMLDIKYVTGRDKSIDGGIKRKKKNKKDKVKM